MLWKLISWILRLFAWPWTARSLERWAAAPHAPREGRVMSLALSEFACHADCPYFGNPWPRHMPKPTCRLIAESPSVENPVTLAVYRDMIRNRMNAHCAQKEKGP